MISSLSETWFTEGYLDFEMKKYTLLAYLQFVNSCFKENKLYPPLNEIIFHYNNIMAFKENRKFLADHFPKQLVEINIKKLQLEYEKIIDDDEMMHELEEIVQFAEEQIKPAIKNGTEIYECVEDKLTIEPVGIIPIDINDGYLLLSDDGQDVVGYRYHMTIYEKYDEKYRGIHTNFVQKWGSSAFNSIKLELIKIGDISNPAVYNIRSVRHYPMEETFLPVAKRIFMKYTADE